jgi:hypothetical protein
MRIDSPSAGPARVFAAASDSPSVEYTVSVARAFPRLVADSGLAFGPCRDYYRAARRSGADMFGSTSTILMLIAVIVIYILPTLIAFGREHPHRQDLLVLNLLLGWTLIGWIGVFLWATLARAEDTAILP